MSDYFSPFATDVFLATKIWICWRKVKDGILTGCISVFLALADICKPALRDSSTSKK